MIARSIWNDEIITPPPPDSKRIQSRFRANHDFLLRAKNECHSSKHDSYMRRSVDHWWPDEGRGEMMAAMSSPSETSETGRIRLGFVPYVDGAPIAVATARGIFKSHGLDVGLTREIGWASIREKLIHGELDAAQSIAGIPITLSLGVRSSRCEIIVPLILNLQGSAIILSNEFGRERIGEGEHLGSVLKYDRKKGRPFILAVPHRDSTHVSFIQTWLNRLGITFPGPVEILALPAFLMPRHLEAGMIDGYCTGEPWSSEAVAKGIGWCPVRSSDLARYHPESVLAARGGILRERKDELLALVTALIEACELCQSPEFRPELVSILSRPEFIGASRKVLEKSLGPASDTGVDRGSSGFPIFSGSDTNRPDLGKASWVYGELRKVGAVPEKSSSLLPTIYREDLFHEAQARMAPSGEATPEVRRDRPRSRSTVRV